MGSFGIRGLSLTALTAALLACEAPGKVVGRATLTAEGSTEVTFSKGAAPIEIWTKFDGKWKGGKYSKLPFMWTLEVKQGAKSLGQVECDSESSNGTIYCGTSTNIGGVISEDCEVRLTCALPPLEVGPVSVQVVGKKKDPARILEIREMSLVFREP
jgi:hypothetical protein